MDDGGTVSMDGEAANAPKQGPGAGILAPSDFFTDIPSSAQGLHDGDDNAQPPDEPSEQGTSTSTPSGPHRPQVDAHGRTLNPRSCVTCRKRKVRCDKLHPCNNCNRAHIECVFPSPGRAPRKARKVGEGRDKELLERLRRLEGVVKGLGVEVPGGTQGATPPTIVTEDNAGETANGGTALVERNSDKPTPSSVDVTASPQTLQDQQFREKTDRIEDQKQGRFENRFGRLVINEGKSRYINSSFWANLSNEVEDLKGILNQSSDDEDGNSPDNGASLSHQGWIFGFSSQSADLLSLHPLPGQIPLYWATYKDRVDPLVKVLHVPTLEPTILSAASHLSNLSKGFEVLLFAIYYGAVTSLSPQDCQLKFGEDKTVLLSRYRFGVEQALARANFLTTEEVVVLQAFVIFLICVRRNNDARVIWTLTGLIVRMAQTLGVHRDGAHFGLPPFQVELRRRLWWQVCILDTRASEDHGCDPTIIEQSFDTKMPLNVNDVDLSPDMKDFPPERQGCTDMSFCLIRCEVANTFRRINYVPPGPPRACHGYYSSITLQDKEKWITECHQRLEERYLKHCDMSVPLFWVTATVARLMMSKMWLMVYHPFQRQDGGVSLPNETKEKLFITSLENIEYALLLETEARTMKWGWLFKTYMQWHALAFMLSELCHRVTGDLVERAWVAVEKTRDGRWGLHMSDDESRAGHLWRPLKKLYRKAKDARQRGLQEEQLAQQRAANPPSRTYSPNANPMFGHPHRPGIVRAPLSQAQLVRFTEGPTFGQMPLDKHELLKSPRMMQMNGGSEVDPMEATDMRMEGVQQPLPQRTAQGPGNTAAPVSGYDTMFPGSMGSSTYAPKLQNAPGFGQNFLNGMGNMDQSMPLGNPTSFSTSPDINGITMGPTVSNTSTNNELLRMNSVDSNNFDLEAAGLMDTSGDLNWENWDQLVRQFGMDVEQPITDANGTTRWTGQNFDMGANVTPGNMRMAGGDWYRTGGGDWF